MCIRDRSYPAKTLGNWSNPLHVKGEGMIKAYLLSILHILSSLHRYFSQQEPLPLAMPTFKMETLCPHFERWATKGKVKRTLHFSAGYTDSCWAFKDYIDAPKSITKSKTIYLFCSFWLQNQLWFFFKHRVWLLRNILWICPCVSKGRIWCQLRLKIQRSSQ